MYVWCLLTLYVKLAGSFICSWYTVQVWNLKCLQYGSTCLRPKQTVSNTNYIRQRLPTREAVVGVNRGRKQMSLFLSRWLLTLRSEHLGRDDFLMSGGSTVTGVAGVWTTTLLSVTPFAWKPALVPSWLHWLLVKVKAKWRCCDVSSYRGSGIGLCYRWSEVSPGPREASSTQITLLYVTSLLLLLQVIAN